VLEDGRSTRGYPIHREPNRTERRHESTIAPCRIEPACDVFDRRVLGTARDMEQERDELLELERAGWRSLCDGTGSDYYGTIMTDDARMVLGNGTVMSRREVVDALAKAPPWSSYTIEDPIFLPIDDDVVALVYIGTGHRTGGDDFTGVMTSVYVRRAADWKLALYQQTPRS
jgi:hypothetical protein